MSCGNSHGENVVVFFVSSVWCCLGLFFLQNSGPNLIGFEWFMIFVDPRRGGCSFRLNIAGLESFNVGLCSSLRSRWWFQKFCYFHPDPWEKK